MWARARAGGARGVGCQSNERAAPHHPDGPQGPPCPVATDAMALPPSPPPPPPPPRRGVTEAARFRHPLPAHPHSTSAAAAPAASSDNTPAAATRHPAGASGAAAQHRRAGGVGRECRGHHPRRPVKGGRPGIPALPWPLSVPTPAHLLPQPVRGGDIASNAARDEAGDGIQLGALHPSE